MKFFFNMEVTFNLFSAKKNNKSSIRTESFCPKIGDKLSTTKQDNQYIKEQCYQSVAPYNTFTSRKTNELSYSFFNNPSTTKQKEHLYSFL